MIFYQAILKQPDAKALFFIEVAFEKLHRLGVSSVERLPSHFDRLRGQSYELLAY